MSTFTGWEFATAMRRSRERGFEGLKLEGLDGRAIYGPQHGATVFVGLGIDHLLMLVGKKFDGHKKALGWQLTELERREHRITARHVERYAVMRRVEQIGVDNADATFARVKGRYGGKNEPAVTMGFIFTYPEREVDFAAFQENILAVCEDLAYAFAQQEVIGTFQSADEEGRARFETHSLTPYGFPPATDRKALKKFVEDAHD